MESLKDIKQEDDICKFLILIFIINVYMSGISLGFTILIAILFIYLGMIMHVR